MNPLALINTSWRPKSGGPTVRILDYNALERVYVVVRDDTVRYGGRLLRIQQADLADRWEKLPLEPENAHPCPLWEDGEHKWERETLRSDRFGHVEKFGPMECACGAKVSQKRERP